MTKPRLLPALALSATLLLASGAVFAQGQAIDASPPPGDSMAAEDTRLTELEALVPPTLAGLSLAENLQLATGEQLTGVMSAEERAALGNLLELNGRTVSDYAAANTWLSITDTDIVVIQAHRIEGVDAAQAVDAWVEILSMGLEEPLMAEGAVGARPVTLVSDGTRPEVPPLHLFPGGDVMWMIVAADEAIVEEAVKTVEARREQAQDSIRTGRRPMARAGSSNDDRPLGTLDRR